MVGKREGIVKAIIDPQAECAVGPVVVRWAMAHTDDRGTTTPNVVFIITDNQSAWTLGCYGNSDIRTERLDRLAAEGLRFENAFCVNPVCSPNRATYLTGLMPSQHGVHNWLGGERPDAQMGTDAYCTIEEFDTLPERFASSGYRCAMVGKWHLGDSVHPQLGFEYWFAKPKGHTKTFYDAEAIWEGEVYTERRYYTDAITDHAVDFLRSAGSGKAAQEADAAGRTGDSQPFFLYVGYNGPYGLDGDLRTGHRNRWTDYYASKDLPCFPREPMHPWLRQNTDIYGSKVAMRGYAAAVSGVDDGVGSILDTLEDIGEAGNTLVIFIADQGLCAGHHGFWGMGDHSRPMHMVEENLRIPLIFRHPDVIRPGTWDGHVCTYDLFPTFLTYLSLTEPTSGTSTDRPRPGRDYAHVLRADHGQSAQAWDDTTFHEYENTRAIHTRTHKLIRRYPDGPDELYDLEADPGERENLIDSEEASRVRSDLEGRLTGFFEEYADPEYDLWNGGRTKAGRAIPELAPEPS